MTVKMYNSIWLAGITAAALVVGCGDDEKEDRANPGGGSPDSGMLPPNPLLDAGNTPPPSDTTVDAAAPMPTEDAAPALDAETADDGATESDAQTDAGAGDTDGGDPLLVPLPADGERLSVCYSAADCKGDDLTCYMPDSARPGFCTDDCQTDTDCRPLGGIATACSPDGQCRIDCAGTGQGDGACPEHMVCRNVPGVTPLLPVYRCTYADGAGKRTAKTNERCDMSHGSGDCEGTTNACYIPALSLGAAFGPGYCAAPCADTAACGPAPAGTTAVPVCGLVGRCELDCGGAGTGNCPTGMNCQDVDQSPLITTYRCRFID